MVHAGKLGQVTNFTQICIDQYMVLFRYCSLQGDTAMPGGLHDARLCHAFLVKECRASTVTRYALCYLLDEAFWLGPFYGAIAVPSVTRCRCCCRCRWRCRRGHRCAGGVRQRHLVNGRAAARSGEWAQHFLKCCLDV